MARSEGRAGTYLRTFLSGVAKHRERKENHQGRRKASLALYSCSIVAAGYPAVPWWHSSRRPCRNNAHGEFVIRRRSDKDRRRISTQALTESYDSSITVPSTTLPITSSPPAQS